MAIVVVGNKKETSPNMLVISRARVVIRLKIKAAGKGASRKERCKAYAWVGLDQTSRQKEWGWTDVESILMWEPLTQFNKAGSDVC